MRRFIWLAVLGIAAAPLAAAAETVELANGSTPRS
jgi:hypothetical protein